MGLPTLLTVGGGLFSAASSVMQGRAQAKAYEAEAKVAEQNARSAQAQATEALKSGAREEERFRRQARQFQGTQRASLAASGTTLSGSALSVLADTSRGIEEDADTIRLNTLREKWGYDVQSANFQNQASAARASAKNAKTAGWIGAGSSLLGTATTVVAGLSANNAQSGLSFKTGIKATDAADSLKPWYHGYRKQYQRYQF